MIQTIIQAMPFVTLVVLVTCLAVILHIYKEVLSLITSLTVLLRTQELLHDQLQDITNKLQEEDDNEDEDQEY